MNKSLIFPICESLTRVYMGNARKDGLCGKHADLLKAGEIKVNENGMFIDVNTNKVLNKNFKSTEIKEVVKDKESDSKDIFTGVTKCIGCCTPTKNGHLF